MLLIILGYILTVLSYICYCFGRFMKQKTTMLFLELIAKIFTVFSLYCFSSLSGVCIYLLAFVMLVVANIKERLHKKWFFVYLIFQSLYLSVLYFTYVGISSVLVVMTGTIKLYSVWFLPPQGMRLSASVNSLLHLYYQMTIKNWAGLLEILPLFSNLLSYKKYKKTKCVRKCK